MPWLFLDLDDSTMELLKQNAARVGVSTMTYAGEVLRQRAASSAWPSSFWDTYGAVTDETFVEPSELDLCDDDFPLATS